MSSFRRLVREAHRRSIWQVLSFYAVSSWVVLQVADTLTQSLGLPEWVPGFALVLLLLGLPVVLATAVVQEGGPNRETWRGTGTAESDAHLMAGEPRSILDAAEEISGGDEARAHASDSAPTVEPGLLARLLTWRNAVLGGVAAFALLGLAVAAYFTMWATGIGPVGSLVAQGVLDERERVVLADFRNATADVSVADVVTEALRVDLVQSPALTVADPSFVDRVLQRMERDPNARLEPELAREVAVREGLKAVIQGEVAPAGEGYLLTAAIVLAEDGRTLAAFRETAESDDELIAAIDALSRGIREKAGESLPSIRAGEPLMTVTTSSLPALRLYTEGLRLEEAGRLDEALAVLEDAVAEDSAFAMAWRKVSVVRNNLRAPLDDTRAAASAAHRHRERLSERERFLAAAYYHDVVTRDREAAEQAYRRVLRTDPDEGVALNNLALILMASDRSREAAELLERAVTGPGGSIQAHRNLVRAHASLGEHDAADRALARFRERFPELLDDHVSSRMIVDMGRGNLESAREAAATIREARDAPLPTRLYAIQAAAISLAAEGRVGEAEARMAELFRLAEAEGRPDISLVERLDWVHLLGRVTGDRQRARAALEAVPVRPTFEALPPSERPWGDYVSALAAAGRADEARDVYETWEEQTPSELQGPGHRADRAEALARLLEAEEDPAGALDAYRRAIQIWSCDRCLRVQRADLLLRLERTGEALPLLESTVAEVHPDVMPTPLERVLALELLGRLHEARGETERAAEAHATFARSWSEADPALQPRVERARSRASALQADDGP